MSYQRPRSNSSESSVKSTSSVRSSSTLRGSTSSDTTCFTLPEDATDDGHSPRKTVRFSAVDLEVVSKRKGSVPPSPIRRQPRETGPITYYSPPPPRPIAMIPQSSTLAAKHLSFQQKSNQYPPNPSVAEVREAQLQPTTLSPKANEQSDLKASHDLPSPPSSQSSPIVASCYKPVRPSGPPKSPSPEKEITFSSAAPPSPSACADINDFLRRHLGIAKFDFATYVQDRVYIVRKVYLASATSVNSDSSFLESDVRSECTSLTEKSLSPCFEPSRLLSLSPPTTIQPDLFVIRYVGDGGYRSGYCVFAQREISTHQIILVERPCAIFPFVIALDGSHKKPYCEAFRSLSPELRNRVVHELSGKPPAFVQGSAGLEFDESYNYEDIVVRNSLLITLDVPEGSRPNSELSAYRGLFLQASKIKHSCRPNAVWFWDLSSFSIIIRAVRPIPKGEEITLAFVPPQLSYKEREEMLMRSKGFNCACESCKPHNENALVENVEHGAVSANGTNSITWQDGDSAREYLLRIRTGSIMTFKQWFTDPSISDHFLTSAHQRALDLIAREGLQILDIQQHGFGVGVASPNRIQVLSSPRCSPRCSPSLSSPSAQSLSAPLSPSSASASSSSKDRPPLTVVPCPQRDIGFHIDMLVLSYGALGDSLNFKLYLGKAIKDRDERSAWLLIDSGSGSEKSESGSKNEEDDYEDKRLRLRLVFLKWAASPTTFPLWARRNLKGTEETTRLGVGSAGALTLTSGLAGGFEIYDSLDEYALHTSR